MTHNLLFEESAEPVLHVPAGKGAIPVRMQEQPIRYHLEKCVLLNNSFEKRKRYCHWLGHNKSREHKRALFQRKNSESGVIAQILPISVSVESAHRLRVSL